MVRTIVAETKLDCEHLLGQFLDESHFDEIINEDKLRIPHPLLQERRFTLEPLKEIAAELIHPAFNKTISDLLNECNDNSEITKYTFNI